MKKSIAVVALSAIVLLTASQARAGSVAPKRPSEFLTLSVGVPGSPGCPLFGNRFDQVVNPDGTLTPFAGIPAGKVFVVTGVNWAATGVPAAPRLVGGAISVQNGASFTQVAGSSVLSDAAGRVGTEIAGDGLAVIKSGPVVCFSIGSGLATMGAQVWGFLVTDK